MTTHSQTKKILSLAGNEIVAKAAIAAGCRFYAGYPISPSSEIAAYMSKLLPEVGGAFIQMEDEIASMAATVGGALAGAKSMTATSGPGFSLKQENLGYACMAEIPCVIVNVMRSGPSTGMPTLPAQGDLMQAKWGTHGDHPIIVLVPTYHNEIYTETIRAFNLAEKYRTPVILMTDEVLSHMSGPVTIPDPSEYKVINREKPTSTPENYKAYDDSVDVPPMANFFEGYRYHVTGLTHDAYGFPTENPVIAQKLFERFERKLTNHLDDILRYEEYLLDDADTLVVSIGSSALSTKQAIIQAREEFDAKVGMFRPVTLWPFPEEALKKAAAGKKRVLVAEMNMGQMALEVERILHRDVELVSKYNGEMISAEEICDRIVQNNAANSSLQGAAR